MTKQTVASATKYDTKIVVQMSMDGGEFSDLTTAVDVPEAEAAIRLHRSWDAGDVDRNGRLAKSRRKVDRVFDYRIVRRSIAIIEEVL